MVDVSLSFSAIIAFSAAAGLLTITPGLDTALIIRTTAVEGSRTARFAALGICGGCLVWGLATALGLTALLALSRIAYEVVRIAGASYLIFLGIQMWRRKRDPAHLSGQDANEIGEPTRDRSARRWFVRGLLTNLLNPKVGVFYVTLLPQFVPAGGSVGLYSVAFTLIHVCEGILWLTLLTVAIGSLRAWFERPSVKRGLDRTTGTVLIGSGLAIAFEKRK